jgi:hypothetical protein
VDFGGISRSLVDIGGNLTLVEFGGIPGLVESSGFLGYVYIGGNFRLVGPSGFSRFRYGICAVSYKALLLAAGGGKYKLKVIPIDGYLV